MYKNLFTTLKRKAEKNHFENKFEQAKGNLKETCKIIKDAINNKQAHSSFPDSFEYENKLINNVDEISKKFNEFFVTIGPKLDAKIDPPPPHVNFKTFFPDNIGASIYILIQLHLKAEEVVTIGNQCKNKYSCGWDDIPMAVVKSEGAPIAVPSAHICNLTFSTGMCPSEIKIAKVTPIYKSDARDEFSNYRPISLLPNFSKILEKLMCKRLADFIDKHKILYEQQYGFRQNSSTDFALIELSERIAEAIEKKQFTIGIFVDLSKAFDTLNHSNLLQKLSNYGIRGLANDWFQSYLNSREQYVNFNNVLSNRCKITTGVSQGSLLGPLLFLVYINDIWGSSRLLGFILYADDINIFYSGENVDQLCETVNSELRGVLQWFKTNRLSVNLKKTNFVMFGSPSKIRKLGKGKIFLDNINITRTDTAKFLGVIIDETLTWKII